MVILSLEFNVAPEKFVVSIVHYFCKNAVKVGPAACGPC